ncbi:hypothetical protein BT96DRAFT_192745 [Gymnopus androsaceus JB14]|uniref:GST N-terminal domain-containing protein n=1 Tax=Gymnopus androsaceus JB14 TaxID=1447944 RepID=A0A6A4IA99_9AGAR|nr:hypothetical protein BT96DRAFT_192745 [Gymnopus androsaceus JB14]
MSDDKTAIIFYDIPFAEPGVCWSPNTWKTRYCLNYKGLPYRTEWIEYPDIEALCVKLGAAPTDVKDDGAPHYTLPVIYDPTTNRAISESFDIAVYLDATYPSTPRLIPAGMQGIQSAFISYVMSRTVPHLGQFARPLVFQKLPPGRSQEYFKRTREASIGGKIEEWTPRGEDRVREWKAAEKGLMLVEKSYQIAGKETGGGFICGEHPTFADFALAGILQWCKESFGAESEEWKDILSWENRRWETLLNSLEEFA